MNARVWEHCGNPFHLLRLAHGRNDPRRFRRYNIACARRVADLLDERSQHYLESLAGFLDGMVLATRWWGAYQGACRAYEEARDALAQLRREEAVALAEAGIHGTLPERLRAQCHAFHQDRERILHTHARAKAALAVVWAAQPNNSTAWHCRSAVRFRRVWRPGDPATSEPDVAAEAAAQAELVRDVYVNPYLPPPTLATECRAWRGGLLGEMARTIEAEDRWQDLPILADALEEAGGDARLSEHARRPVHVRGCWLVEVLTSLQ